MAHLVLGCLGSLACRKKEKGHTKGRSDCLFPRLFETPPSKFTSELKNCNFLVAATHFVSSHISAPFLSSSTVTGTKSAYSSASEASPAPPSTRCSSVGASSTNNALTSAGDLSSSDNSTGSSVSASTESPSTPALAVSPTAASSGEDVLEATSSTAIASSTISGICAIVYTVII